MSHQSELIESDILGYLKQHEHKELLRFLTCGSVDDGKSTLIGRLLYDSKMVYEDQLAAVTADSKKFGTTGGTFDPALLTDGLKAEREQGITIDVAYRYFSTAKRKFIIADTPGHEQYTRNMATGASTCDLAIILIDARHGVQTQTRRHSFIASLLGIKHVVVAINKMDLVDYSEQVFEDIKREYSAFAAKLELPDIRFVPMSALDGDNVVNPSENMPWYSGGTLMHLLENVHIASDRNLIDFRFPVQYVSRPDLNFRGFAGTIASGVVRPGDEVMALPSRKTSKVKRIVTREGDLDEASAPMAPTIVLEDEIDVSRGDMLVHPNNAPKVDQAFEAMVVWMSEQPLTPGKQYLIKHTTQTTNAVVSDMRYRMDVNTLHRDKDAQKLELNEIGRVVVEVAKPLCFDPYTRNRGTGGFIVIDKLTNSTVGAGMILNRDPDSAASKRRQLAEQRGTQVRCHESLVSAEERATRLGHKPATVWLTGLTGAGKSPIAYALERRLFDEGKSAAVLDGRNARLGLSSDLDFSQDDRRENLRRAAEAAKLFNDTGHIAVCAFLSPSAEDRAMARDIVGEERFIEVYLDAPEDVCKKRAGSEEFKGAKQEMAAFSDMAAPYEPPSDPALTIETDELTVDVAVQRIVDLLMQRGVLA
ncbi:MAG: sulfate adenylyltransferase subunit CysN [Phycisphaerales bacterium JB063]